MTKHLRMALKNSTIYKARTRKLALQIGTCQLTDFYVSLMFQRVPKQFGLWAVFVKTTILEEKREANCRTS